MTHLLAAALGAILGAALRRAVTISREVHAYHRGIDALAARLYDERRVSAVEVSKAADAVRSGHGSDR